MVRLFGLNMIPEEEKDETLPFNKAAGFRFAPTDAEIVIGYLKRFLHKEGLPQNKIHQKDVYSYHPDELSDNFEKANEKEFYFIIARKGDQRSRTAKNGYWHSTTGKRDVHLGDQKIGEKQHLTFYDAKQGNTTKEAKTKWLMVEYRLVEVDSETGILSRNKEAVLCKIYRSDAINETRLEYEHVISKQQQMAILNEAVWKDMQMAKIDS